VRFTSRDVSRVETTWRDYVPSAVLQRADPQRFRFDWHSADLAGVSLVRYALAAEIRSLVEPQNQLLVCRVDGPDVAVWSGRDDLDPTKPWVTDGAQVRARWEKDADVRALVFDRDAVNAFARQLSGDDQLILRVQDLRPRDAEAAAQWGRTFRYLEQSVGDDSPAPLLRAELGRHALSVTLGTFATSLYDVVGRPAQTAAAPAAVRRALAYISENAHRAITVDDVAAAVHMSTRGLQYAFRRSLDATPAESLRRARLDGAHRDLRASPQDSVATIARRWGYAHPSRFASAYRAAYGMHPSETRRRSG
jgi:AraC-like DNA-binding protein